MPVACDFGSYWQGLYDKTLVVDGEWVGFGIYVVVELVLGFPANREVAGFVFVGLRVNHKLVLIEDHQTVVGLQMSEHFHLVDSNGANYSLCIIHIADKDDS